MYTKEDANIYIYIFTLYTYILYHKEHPPEVWHILPGTPCIYHSRINQRDRNISGSKYYNFFSS
jgi:hypothetical protein